MSRQVRQCPEGHFVCSLHKDQLHTRAAFKQMVMKVNTLTHPISWIVFSSINTLILSRELNADVFRVRASSAKALASRADSSKDMPPSWPVNIPATIASPAPTVLRTPTFGGRA